MRSSSIPGNLTLAMKLAESAAAWSLLSHLLVVVSERDLVVKPYNLPKGVSGEVGNRNGIAYVSKFELHGRRT